MTGEVWRPVVGFDRYSVSDLGRVMRDGKIIRPVLNASQKGRKPRHAVNLYGAHGQSCRNVHNLVMEAFVGPRAKGHVVRHRNGDGTDNRLCNLSYEADRHYDRDLTPEDVAAIKQMRADGVVMREVGARFGISREYATAIAAGRAKRVRT